MLIGIDMLGIQSPARRRSTESGRLGRQLDLGAPGERLGLEPLPSSIPTRGYPTDQRPLRPSNALRVSLDAGNEGPSTAPADKPFSAFSTSIPTDSTGSSSSTLSTKTTAEFHRNHH